MKIKNLLITKHGSHLYGMATPTSDIDLYVVYDFYHRTYRPKRLIRQSIDDESDTTKIYVEKFREQVMKGVPQSLEALFAPLDAWLESHSDWELISFELEGCVIRNMPAILETYKRTAMNFMLEDNFKKTRHALRLLHNARELKETGRMNPSLDEGVVQHLTKLAKLPFAFRTEKFKELMYNTFHE